MEDTRAEAERHLETITESGRLSYATANRGAREDVIFFFSADSRGSPVETPDWGRRGSGGEDGLLVVLSAARHVGEHAQCVPKTKSNILAVPSAVERVADGPDCPLSLVAGAR